MSQTSTKTSCYHCSEDCEDNVVVYDEKSFCCEGCKLVYELLSENNLCNYYDLDQKAGISRKDAQQNYRYSFLEDVQLKKSLVKFTDGSETHVNFQVPSMHCSSCVYLLENLHKLDKGVIKSTVNFPKKEVEIIYKEEETSLSKIAELMASIGYEPHVSLEQLDKKESKHNRSRIYKIGIAGFAFGNIMMLSFPEYFSLGNFFDQNSFTSYFGYLNIVLSLPVFFYAAYEFFESGIKSLKKGFLNIDLPIALAVLVTFVRSLYEILSHTGAGYLDSMSGIVFFMLIGRYFQDRTYETLSFERDYKSFFPLAITKLNKGKEEQIPVNQVKKGDHLLIRNKELIPADGILIKGDAQIDYSFVTGESTLIHKDRGDLLYAGGRQEGSSLMIEVVKEVSQSYLTRLWNKDVFQERKDAYESFIHTISKYFTIVLFVITALAFFYWLRIDVNLALNALTTTLIIACPCALLLSSTFTNGNIIRLYGKYKFYLKNSDAIEKLSDIDVIVFDKTGTITEAQHARINYVGNTLSQEKSTLLSNVFRHSAHPLSKRVYDYLGHTESIDLAKFTEIEGKGIIAEFDKHVIRIGSEKFILSNVENTEVKESRVYIEIDNKYYGYFALNNVYRNGFSTLVNELKNKYKLMLLSGDHDSEKEILQYMLGENAELHFKQSPEDKLSKIKSLQSQGKKVMMIGDGLNDAGALKQSDIGIAVTDHANYFSPACDVIMDGSVFNKLYRFIRFSTISKNVIIASFIISILYNIVGLFFAVQGQLSPVIAAILMPASSISIVLFTTVSSSLFARRLR
ncbi:MAG: heavy metal translocating P-type ATPase [bacterium]|jgi:Cu+-exporting ATPase